ncbi:FecR domain-containing protein [Rhodoferax sp.]|uniref:FecR family protein n=1 Tax=Rhodoferax sp. TaxID=50421 RepID=UPI0027772676|nr:FecR family protein [Rhodoferax sp.]
MAFLERKQFARLWLPLLGLLTSLWMPGAAAQDAAAGRFERIEGTVLVLDVAGAKRPAVAGASVGVGERVETQSGATDHVTLADGGLLVVRPDSTVAVLQYRAQAKPDDGASLSLLRGALRLVTGWLGKAQPRSVLVSTSTATLGIRGTDFELIDNPQGSHVRVISGEVLMGSAGGDVAVQPGEMASLLRGGDRPRRLERGQGRVFEELQGAFSAVKGAGRLDELVAAHANGIEKHIEASLRERGLLRVNESVRDFVERRRADVDILHSRGELPSRDELLERMQNRRDAQTDDKPKLRPTDRPERPAPREKIERLRLKN